MHQKPEDRLHQRCFEWLAVTPSAVCLDSSHRYRQDAAKRQTTGIKFTHRPKIRDFARQGRLVARFTSSLAGPKGTWVRLAVQKFHLSRRRGVGMRPQKFLLFGRVASHGRTPWPISNSLGAFIRPTIMRQWFKFDVIRLTGYGVIAEQPRVGQLGRIFPCTL